MVDRPGLAPRRRDAILLLLALALLATPFLIGQFHVDDSVREYERIEVTAEDGTVEYGPAYTGNLVRVPISDHIGCTYNHYRSNERYCALEGSLAREDRRVLTGWATGPTPIPETSEYRYLALNGSIYEPTVRVNDTPDPDRDPNRTKAVYPIYFDLEPVPAERALRSVSVSVTAGFVPDPVRRAATTGGATTQTDVEIPPHPIHLEDGSYYRVYESDASDPPVHDRVIYLLARYLAPVLGIGTLYVVSRNVSVQYTGGRSGPDRDS